MVKNFTYILSDLSVIILIRVNYCCSARKEGKQVNLVNEKVEHIKFGLGVITELKDHRIYVKFQNNRLGVKEFLYPEAFEKFLKAENPKVGSSAKEELRIKQYQISKERERKASELREKMESMATEKKKSSSKSTKKKTSTKKTT